MTTANTGRLIRTLNEKCSDCTHPLQLRGRKIKTLVRGEEVFEEEEYKVCSNCKEEIEIPLRDRKKRVTRFDKTNVKEPIEEKKSRRFSQNASSFKRSATSKNNGKSRQ